MTANSDASLNLSPRDRRAVLVGLGGITALSWTYLIVAARGMTGMAGMRADGMAGMEQMVQIQPWTGLDFLLMFLMWTIMMVGMMVPTVAPTTLIYAAVARKAKRQNSPLAPTAVFVAGYVAMWTLFSTVATAGQWALDQAALLSPTMVSNGPRFGAVLLIAAGLWQLTPMKNACLRHCRNPAMFLSDHWRDGTGGAFRMGLEHGAWCLGCCWVLMGLLFLGGVMNLLWVAAIAVFVLLEKVIPHGIGGGRLAGAGMILVGVLLLTGFSFG